jgi:hypothetical protein
MRTSATTNGIATLRSAVDRRHHPDGDRGQTARLPPARDRERLITIGETRRERQIVEKKNRIKASIGHSPDFADSLLAAWWCKMYQLTARLRVRRGVTSTRRQR